MEGNRTRRRWTYSEFARLPDGGGVRHEVIDDELFVTPAPGLRHQRIVTRLVALLHDHVRTHALGEVFAGPVDVLFAEGDYLEPDIVFVSSGRSQLLTERGVEGAPDLVVEVTSPSTVHRDRGLKLDRYRRYGVREYWIVDPDEGTVERWRFGLEGTEPEVVRQDGTLHWAPAMGSGELHLHMESLLAD